MNYRLARLLIFIAGACFLGVGARLIYLKIAPSPGSGEAAYYPGEGRKMKLAGWGKKDKPAGHRRRGGTDDGSATPSPTPPLFAILTESLPMAAVGEEYREELKVKGAVGAVIWKLEKGQFPPGLELKPDGVIAGAPEKEGDYHFTVAVEDPKGKRRAVREFRLLVRRGDEAGEDKPLAILTSSLPEAVLGKDYLQPIAAEGGKPPYSWELVAGSLPRLLLLNKESGVIYGIPRETGTFRFTIQLTDEPGDSVEMNYDLSIREEGLRIVTAALPPAPRGQEYSVRLTAQGGVLPYAWELVSGVLPEGLLFNAERGEISGIAQKIVAAQILIRVRDTQGRTAEREFSLQVLESGDAYFGRLGVGRFRILNTFLSPATRGRPYTAQLQAADGAPPYTWTVSQGNLPPQLFLDSDTGALGGVPEKEGVSSFTILVSDRNLATAQAYLTLTVNLQLVYITTGSLNPAVAGQPYQGQLEVTGGTPPYSWALDSGSLPPDLSLNPSSGLLSGRVSDSFLGQGPREFVFRIKASDRQGDYDIVELRLQVRESAQPTPFPTSSGAPGPSPTPQGSPAAPLAIATDSLPEGTVGNDYSAALSAQGGKPPYSWTATGLPDGLSLSSSGAISGAPSAAGTFTVSIRVVDAAGASAQADVTLKILEVYSEAVSNLIAAPGDGKVGLAWINPESVNFARVDVLRKTVEFPATPSDGTLVYQGT
ncbi:MAG: Ig domain-containing protein, partial [Candidatus Aureabacteria bacterium]|nr:Ig domain-containing protein [Candidatus Auribacterota bacterium]